MKLTSRAALAMTAALIVLGLGEPLARAQQQDKSGPIMVNAFVLEGANQTNRIQITWNEALLTTAPFRSPTNFTVILMPDNIVVGVSSVVMNNGTFPGSPLIPPVTILTMNTSNWYIGSNYCVVVNYMRDQSSNVIAPNSRICVSWPNTTNVMHISDSWDFFNQYFLYNAFTGTNMYTLPWMATNFVLDPASWGNGPGILWRDPLGQIVRCADDTLGDNIAIQDQPTLFRRTFLLPTKIVAASAVRLKLRYIVDDGAVFFLNGKELSFRENMGNSVRGDPIVATTLAGPNVPNPTCKTNDNVVLPPDVPLFPGTNWMAVAVCQGNPLPPNGAEDIAFGLEMDVRFYDTPSAPPNPVPTLTVTRPTPTSVSLSWPNGFGYALESTPSLSQPMWMEVQPNMANPMLITNLSTMGNSCFFQLRKVQLE